MIASHECLDRQTISDLVSGNLPQPRFQDAIQHLDECPSCRGIAEQSNSLQPILTEQIVDSNNPFEQESECIGIINDLVSRDIRPNLRETAASLSLEKLGGYQVQGLLGTGGMSNVFLAVHERLRRQVAIKLLPKEKLNLPGWLDRFNREMTSIAALEHPNVVRALDAGEDQEQHYLVMEYLEGLDVGKISRRIPRLEIADACEIIRQAALGLQAIHDADMVHRDIKPSNLFLSRQGTVKILDLGLVLDGESPVASNERLTTVGHLMGTLPYMPREQLNDSSQVSSKADIYSLGATLYRLLTGQPPFGGGQNLPLTIQNIQSSNCPHATTLRDDLPKPLADLVARMLDHDSESRPHSAAEIAEELVAFCGSHNLKRLVHRAESMPDNEASYSPLVPSYAIHEGGSRSKWKTWLGLAFIPLAAIGGILLTLATDRGDLVIQSDLDGVEVSIKRNDERVDSLKLSKDSDSTVRLWTGEYELSISGPQADKVVLEQSEISIFRGEQRVVHVTHASETSNADGGNQLANKTLQTNDFEIEPSPPYGKELLLKLGQPPLVIKTQKSIKRLRMLDPTIADATPLTGGNRLEFYGYTAGTTWVDLLFSDESLLRLKIVVVAASATNEKSTNELVAENTEQADLPPARPARILGETNFVRIAPGQTFDLQSSYSFTDLEVDSPLNLEVILVESRRLRLTGRTNGAAQVKLTGGESETTIDVSIAPELSQPELYSLILRTYHFHDDLSKAYEFAKNESASEKIFSIQTDLASNTLQIVASPESHERINEHFNKLATSGQNHRQTRAKLFQGKDLLHWLSVLSVEKDSETLATAIQASVLLAETDVEMLNAAREVLRPARKLGGMTMDRRNPNSDFFVYTPDSASQWYMSDLLDWFKEFPVRIQIKAMADELFTAEGTEKSAFAITWLLFKIPSNELEAAANNREQVIVLNQLQQGLANNLDTWMDRLESIDRLGSTLDQATSLESMSLSSAVELGMMSRVRINALLHGSEKFKHFLTDEQVVKWSKLKLKKADESYRNWKLASENPGTPVNYSGWTGGGGMYSHSNPATLGPFIASLICETTEQRDLKTIPLVLGLLNANASTYDGGLLTRDEHLNAFQLLAKLDRSACAEAVVDYLSWCDALTETQNGFGTQPRVQWPDVLSDVSFDVLADHPQPLQAALALIDLFPLKENLPTVAEKAERALDQLLARLILETDSDDPERAAKLAFGARAICSRKLATKGIIEILLDELPTDEIEYSSYVLAGTQLWPGELETQWTELDHKPGAETTVSYLPAIIMQEPKSGFETILASCDELTNSKCFALCNLLSRLLSPTSEESGEAEQLKKYLKSDEGKNLLSQTGRKLSTFAGAIEERSSTTLKRGGSLGNQHIRAVTFRLCGRISERCDEYYSDEFAAWLNEVLLDDASLPLDDQLSLALPISAESTSFELNAATRLKTSVDQELLFKVLRRVAWTPSSTNEELEGFIHRLYAADQVAFEAFFMNSMEQAGAAGFNGLANFVRRRTQMQNQSASPKYPHPWQTIVDRLRSNPQLSKRIDQILDDLAKKHDKDQFFMNAVGRLKATR